MSSELSTVWGWLVSYPFKRDRYLRGNFFFVILEADVDGLGFKSRRGSVIDGLGFEIRGAIDRAFFRAVISSLEAAVAVKNAEAVCYLAVHC